MTSLLLPLYIVVFIATFLITVIVERALIPHFKERTKQPIYEAGPKWHKTKAGTPSMGGVAFLIAIVLTLALCCVFLTATGNVNEAWLLICSLIYASLNSVVGIIDDIKKIKRNKNDKGLTPTQKLIMQIILSIAFVIALKASGVIDTTLTFSRGEINIGALYYPFIVIVLVGITNCANLTDGIDGLASSVAFAIGVSLFYISYAIYPTTSLIGCALMGGGCGFLIYNINPAKIFMGDTGSLFFGSLIASASLSLGNPLIVITVCIVYVIEGISVILQVIYFKATRKRLFRMAPLHHHLEKCGWSENTICIVAIIITFIMSIPAFLAFVQ